MHASIRSIEVERSIIDRYRYIMVVSLASGSDETNFLFLKSSCCVVYRSELVLV